MATNNKEPSNSTNKPISKVKKINNKILRKGSKDNIYNIEENIDECKKIKNEENNGIMKIFNTATILLNLKTKFFSKKRNEPQDLSNEINAEMNKSHIPTENIKPNRPISSIRFSKEHKQLISNEPSIPNRQSILGKVTELDFSNIDNEPKIPNEASISNRPRISNKKTLIVISNIDNEKTISNETIIPDESRIPNKRNALITTNIKNEFPLTNELEISNKPKKPCKRTVLDNLNIDNEPTTSIQTTILNKSNVPNKRTLMGISNNDDLTKTKEFSNKPRIPNNEEKLRTENKQNKLVLTNESGISKKPPIPDKPIGGFLTIKEIIIRQNYNKKNRERMKQMVNKESKSKLIDLKKVSKKLDCEISHINYQIEQNLDLLEAISKKIEIFRFDEDINSVRQFYDCIKSEIQALELKNSQLRRNKIETEVEIEPLKNIRYSNDVNEANVDDVFSFKKKNPTSQKKLTDFQILNRNVNNSSENIKYRKNSPEISSDKRLQNEKEQKLIRYLNSKLVIEKDLDSNETDINRSAYLKRNKIFFKKPKSKKKIKSMWAIIKKKFTLKNKKAKNVESDGKDCTEIVRNFIEKNKLREKK